MPEDREGRWMLFQGAEFSDTCALFTLLFPTPYPSAAVQCDCMETNLAFKGPVQE